MSALACVGAVGSCAGGINTNRDTESIWSRARRAPAPSTRGSHLIGKPVSCTEWFITFSWQLFAKAARFGCKSSLTTEDLAARMMEKRNLDMCACVGPYLCVYKLTWSINVRPHIIIHPTTSKTWNFNTAILRHWKNSLYLRKEMLIGLSCFSLVHWLYFVSIICHVTTLDEVRLRFRKIQMFSDS